jgi:hypothetical protein
MGEIRMTPEEWKERCANRFIERAGVDADTAKEQADLCFEFAQDGEFCRLADYSPEVCADEEMCYWEKSE